LIPPIDTVFLSFSATIGVPELRKHERWATRARDWSESCKENLFWTPSTLERHEENVLGSLSLSLLLFASLPLLKNLKFRPAE
jgi:hypothetical protein